MSRLIAVALFLLFAFRSIAVEPVQWPRFLGPNGSGVHPSADPPAELSLETGVAWRVELPAGHSSPCIWGSRVFLTAFDSDAAHLITICIDRGSGKILWRKGSPPVEEIEKVHRVSNPAAPTPVTDGQRVVVYFGSYGLIAYDMDGAEVWKTPLPLAKADRGYGTGSSPIIIDDKVVQWLALQNESALVAYRLRDGNRVWEAKRGQFNRTWATPVHWRHGDEARVGILSSQRFSALDADTGEERWWVEEIAINSGSSPVVSDDQLLLTSAGMQGDSDNIVVPDDFDTFAKAYDANGDGKIAFKEIPDSVLFTKRNTSDGAGDMKLKSALRFIGIQPDHVFDRAGWEQGRAQMKQFKNGPEQRTSAALVKFGGTGNVTQSHRVWEHPRGVGEVPSPLVYDGLIYLVKNGGLLTVRSLADGGRIYAKRIRGARWRLLCLSGGSRRPSLFCDRCGCADCRPSRPRVPHPIPMPTG